MVISEVSRFEKELIMRLGVLFIRQPKNLIRAHVRAFEVVRDEGYDWGWEQSHDS